MSSERLSVNNIKLSPKKHGSNKKDEDWPLNTKNAYGLPPQPNEMSFGATSDQKLSSARLHNDDEVNLEPLNMS